MRRNWPKVYKVVHKSGNYSWVVDLGLHNGKRKRPSFGVRDDAERFAESVRAARRRVGELAFSLDALTMATAAKCVDRLKKHGLTIEMATEFAIKHLANDAPTVSDVVARLMKAVEARRRKANSIHELRMKVNRFAAAFGTRKVGTIRSDEIAEWIRKLGVGPRTALNFRTKISQLFGFAVRNGWCSSNPVANVDRPQVPDTEPSIFTVDQARLLLANAGKFGLRNYVALGLFAGLRPMETLRLLAADIRLDERVIVIGAHIAKKPTRRMAAINDTLLAWLQVPSDGHAVNPSNFRKRLDGLKTAVGLAAWPQDALRHSFGSYDFAMHGDARKTADAMGHRDPLVFRQHYMALVSRVDAERFWALRP